MNLLLPTEEGEEKWNYVRTVGKDELACRGGTKKAYEPLGGGIEEWIQRFCADPAGIKQFTFERTVINLDKEYLEGRIRSLIASTGFKGHVAITFPLLFSKVVVHSPDKVNRLFSSITSIFTGTKKYETVKAVWPFSDKPGGANRRFVVQSEEEWWNDWRDAIRHAVLVRRNGWVTVEDRLEFLMAPGVDREKIKGWDEEWPQHSPQGSQG